MRQNKHFIYLIVEPNEILRKTVKFKADQIVSLGSFVIASAVHKAQKAGLDVKNDKESMLVFRNDRYIIGLPKTISPDPQIFYNDLPMLEKVELV